MSDRVAVIADRALSAYNFGQGHPMAPIRVQLALRLAEDFGLFNAPLIELIREVEPAGVHDLVKVHVPDFLTAVRAAGHTGDPGDPRFGMGTDDVPVFPRMHEAAAHLCGATLRAVEEVHSGRAQHAVNLFGGMHHAMADRASGFCVYNDVGVAIRWLLDRGVQRVAYVDVDAHHGDGVEAMFYDDPRVLTISLHESGRTLFPGTGWPSDIGGPGALGTAVNVALPAGTADNQWLRAFNAVVPQVLEEFGAEFLVSQHGCDSHFEDSMAHLLLSVDGQRASYSAVHRLAHRLAGGRWVAVGGGGYEVVDVVPRAWTHLIAEAVHQPIAPETPTPEAFLVFVLDLLGRAAPGRMTDGNDPWAMPFERSYHPEDPLDRAIMDTRRAVFPHWGLVADPFGAF
ncbi:MAG TPA: acetoin utilization protein AcuC [Motilibacterales bacterium]|nr:acetoin utilization protein AcuC [Motilibacterales bacterium]